MRNTMFTSVPKSSVVTCKRCGCQNCVWLKSLKTGKPYLVEHAGHGGDGEVAVYRNAFHKCKE